MLTLLITKRFRINAFYFLSDLIFTNNASQNSTWIVMKHSAWAYNKLSTLQKCREQCSVENWSRLYKSFDDTVLETRQRQSSGGVYTLCYSGDASCWKQRNLFNLTLSEVLQSFPAKTWHSYYNKYDCQVGWLGANAPARHISWGETFVER